MCDLNEPVKLEFLIQSGASLSEAEESIREGSNDVSLEASFKTALERFDELCEWFAEEAAELKQIGKADEAIERYFLPINNPERERVAVAMAKLKLGLAGSGKDGVVGKISRLFKR